MKRSLILFSTCLAMMGAALLGRSLGEASLAPEYRPVSTGLDLPAGFQFGPITGLVVDSKDNLYLFHRGKKPIAVFDAKGKFLRSWGDGIVKTAHGIRLDRDGNVWTTDLGTHQVIKYDPQGKVLLTLGKKNMPGTTNDTFNKPADVAFASNGDVYVADGYGNSRVVRFSKDGKYLGEWGRRGKQPGEFHLPHAIVIDGHDRVYVGDRENNRVQVFDKEGKLIEAWANTGAPYGLVLLGKDRMALADGRGNAVRILDRKGETLAKWGMKGQDEGSFRMPHAIGVDSTGAIYIGEVDGKRLQKFEPAKKS